VTRRTSSIVVIPAGPSPSRPPQRPHPVGRRLLAQGAGVRPREDQLLDPSLTGSSSKIPDRPRNPCRRRRRTRADPQFPSGTKPASRSTSSRNARKSRAEPRTPPQIVRTSRCARTPTRTDGAGTPRPHLSRRRDRPGASFVWRVDSTCAPSGPSEWRSPPSRGRGSPHEDHVGVLPHDGTQPEANVRPICGFTWIWMTPGSGTPPVLDGDDLRAGDVISRRAA